MNRKFLYKLFSIFCFCSVLHTVNAQSGNTNYFTPNVFTLSPNSAAFAKFGNYPVNLYSGLPDISIPLFNIEAGGLSVPVTLSYHASGNKITDVASWVGLGWSINGFGSITRAIFGLQDDNGYLKGDMKRPPNLNPSTNNSDIDYLRETVENKAWDNMPDIYSYQLPGYSGEFFFDGNNNYKIEKVPFSPIRISALTATDTIAGFNITDDHGNYFSLGHTYRELTGFNHGAAISAWMLEQMISQNKRDTINFSYTTDVLEYPDALSETATVEDTYTTVEGPANPGYINPLEPNISIVSNPSTVFEQQMSTVTFKNGKVNFILSQQGRQDVGDNEYARTTVKSLDTIKVSAYNFATKNMEVQKTIIFFKSYFNSGVPGALRLRLDSIEILDKAGSINQHYRFTYNTALNLPPYGSFGRDLWGYYNGHVTETDLIPRMTIPYTNSAGDTTSLTIGSSSPTTRDPDSTFMQANMLTRIDYPTGGYTTFAYQTNRYLDSMHVMHLAGGLRISSISNYANALSTTPVLIKTYQYNTQRSNFVTDGNATFNYGLFSNSQLYRYWTQFFGPDGQPLGFFVAYTKNVRQYFSQPNTELAPDAMPVTYANVTEYDGTPAGNNGKIVYTFRDSPADDVQTATYTGIPINYNFFYARGQLADKQTYLLQPGGAYQIVKDEINGYTAFPTRYYDAVGLAIGQKVYNDGALMGGTAYPEQESPDDVSSNSYPYSYYAIVSADNVLTNTITNIYDINDPTKYVSSGITYTYDDTTHLQVVATTHVDSKGNTRATASIYPYNYAPGNAVIDTMVSHNMLAEAIEKYDTYDNAATGVTAVTGGQLNYYQFGSIANTIVPAKISTLSVAQPLVDFVHSSVVSGVLTGDPRYVQMISFDRYDSQNNIKQYTPRNATPTAILWDYNYELPAAQVKNAPVYSSTLTYFAYTGFEATSKGNWVYSGTPVIDPTAPTGSFVYPLSTGTITSGSLDNTTSYVLSLWAKGGTPSVLYGSTAYTGTALNTANGWTYYEYQLPVMSAGGAMAISSTAVSIDELRLYPAASQMTTYAYDPSGLRSIADTKGSNSYFEYDYFQRLKNVKDYAGNIVKNYGYHYYDQLFGNQVQTASIHRNNCPYGYTGGALTYTVPANKYYSSTQASANTEAAYDMNTNGQLKANANCACNINYLNVQVTNSSGQASFPIYFPGLPTYYVPTGVSNIAVPEGTYSTVNVGPVGTFTFDFTMGARPEQTNVHYGSFTSVSIMPGSSDLTLSITMP